MISAGAVKTPAIPIHPGKTAVSRLAMTGLIFIFRLVPKRIVNIIDLAEKCFFTIKM